MVTFSSYLQLVCSDHHHSLVSHCWRMNSYRVSSRWTSKSKPMVCTWNNNGIPTPKGFFVEFWRVKGNFIYIYRVSGVLFNCYGNTVEPHLGGTHLRWYGHFSWSRLDMHITITTLKYGHLAIPWSGHLIWPQQYHHPYELSLIVDTYM